MFKLNLKKCENTLIGNPEKGIKGISGGERRRLAFGCEVLNSFRVFSCHFQLKKKILSNKVNNRSDVDVLRRAYKWFGLVHGAFDRRVDEKTGHAGQNDHLYDTSAVQ